MITSELCVYLCHFILHSYQMLSPVNSKLISCNTTKCKQALGEGVEIVINHLEPTSSGICAFYNFSL